MDGSHHNGDKTSQVTHMPKKRAYLRGINTLLLSCGPLFLACLLSKARNKFHRKEFDGDTE
jgi:hypothetical protein